MQIANCKLQNEEKREDFQVNDIIIPKDWEELLKRIKTNGILNIVMVIGATDTGKSTLCQFLYRNLGTPSELAALIDADLGQSVIGPPTTVGLSISKVSSRMLHPAGMRFVGSTSPRAHMLQTIVAVKKLVEKAIAMKARNIVIDTSGFIEGAIGREFKFQKIDLVGPTHVVALEKEKEFSLLLRNISYRKGTTICRIKVSKELVKCKSYERRKLYRRERFKSYFENSELRFLSLREIGLHGMIPNFRKKQNWEYLILGLCDSDNNTLSLAITKDIDLSKGLITFISPIKNLESVRSIQFGSIYISQNGEEL
jgi:polynucleotide 5'-hydroxyl-kinase GRC3/NOL9